MRSTKRGLRGVLVLVFTVGLLAVTAGAAFAHVVYAYHGSDQAWVNSTHDTLVALDGECDGNYVYGEGYWYDITIHSERYTKVTDLNGCDPLGNQTSQKPGDFTRFRVCETGVGCSAWKTP